MGAMDVEAADGDGERGRELAGGCACDVGGREGYGSWLEVSKRVGKEEGIEAVIHIRDHDSGKMHKNAARM